MSTTGRAAQPRNLLEHRMVGAFLRSRWYPGVFQAPVAAVFGLVAYQLLAGPDVAHDNAGTALMWVLWWPLMPVFFLLLGRFWCAVCPFATLSDLVQRAVGLYRPVPRFLKNYGIWIIDATFILITWADHVWGIVGSPWGSGVLLLMLTTAVVVSGALFQRRAFCRYLCFLGGLSGNYARTGAVELRADPAVCADCSARAACYNGTDQVAPCPLFTFARTMDSSANCNLCLSCVKACPNDALRLTVRKPTRELWFVRRPRMEESLLAMAIMGIVLIQNVTMLDLWESGTGWLAGATGVTSPALVFTLAFVVAVSVPVLLLVGAARIAAPHSKESVRMNVARFGYALIPLDMAGHIAHNLFHLLAEGGSAAASVAGVFGLQVAVDPMLAGPGTIRALQFLLLGAGAAASLYTGHRIARAKHHLVDRRRRVLSPYVWVILLLTVVNLVLFTQPMAHRM